MASTKRAAGSQGQGAAAVKDGEYEKVPLEGGGYKRRRVGAKKWQHHCEHGKQKERCKECGGKGICEHGRQRYGCKECGGKGICEHGRQRHGCKECGGKGICEHGRIRRYCKECGGKGICEHGRQRHHCQECKAPSSQERGPSTISPPSVQSMATAVVI